MFSVFQVIWLVRYLGVIEHQSLPKEESTLIYLHLQLWNYNIDKKKRKWKGVNVWFKQNKMAAVNSPLGMLITSTFLLLQMSMTSVIEISKNSATIHLDFKKKLLDISPRLISLIRTRYEWKLVLQPKLRLTQTLLLRFRIKYKWFEIYILKHNKGSSHKW